MDAMQIELARVVGQLVTLKSEVKLLCELNGILPGEADEIYGRIGKIDAAIADLAREPRARIGYDAGTVSSRGLTGS